MAEESGSANDYLICRSTESDDYNIWRVDIDGEQLLSRTQAGAKFDRTHQLIPIGNYILEWGPLVLRDYIGGIFPYRLFRFDPDAVARPGSTIKDPLGIGAVFVDPDDGKEKPTVVMKGSWPKKKFWGNRPDFGNPDGPSKAYDKGEKLILLPLGTFVLWIIPTTGRGTFKLFYFDHRSTDPLYQFPTWISGAFETIQFGHELIPMGNYVIDWRPATREYSLWSFDPMNEVTVLARPAIQGGTWNDINNDHQLVPIGEHILDWDMKSRKYRLWLFNPKSSNPLTGPVRSGQMPEEFDAQRPSTKSTDIKGNILTAIQGLRPVDETLKNVPGTVDFMRSKIKHVVYYMIENRSFDHICGWLYEKGEAINFVGHDGPFKGAEHAKDEGRDYNFDFDVEPPLRVPLYKRGEHDRHLPHDPYHDMTDTMRQCFFNEHDGYNSDGYKNHERPYMGGFVWNNGMSEVMSTFTPQEVPVLNGLAKAFAVSDEWFCSMPGATDAQRAFAATGSALLELNNFMNGPKYNNWPDNPNRASIWKVLWANGFTDWKIYNSILWPPAPSLPRFVLTYHLFLEGQIPTVDAEVAAYLAGSARESKYIGNIDKFLDDAKRGTLPAFSFLEPLWIGGGPGQEATSYHPYGDGGIKPGEQALNEIYEALRDGPNWNQTLLIITFDEHGGFFDHVPPPYAENPWPNDEHDGFRYDLMGVRVPTILVSPWIKQQTVFRSSAEVAYDSTSILATLLRWHGIPKARWGLGERTHHAPTFEGVFQCETARVDKPSFKPPTLKIVEREESGSLTELHELMVPRLVHALVGGRLSSDETLKIAEDILARASDAQTLNQLIGELSEKLGFAKTDTTTPHS